jgi:hypothetical protein
MSQGQYKRQPHKFQEAGLILTTPPDLVPPGKLRKAQNIRIDEDTGAIRRRPWLQVINSSVMAGTVHSVSRLNDNIGVMNDFNTLVTTPVYVVGSGPYGAGTVYLQEGPVPTLMDTGYSGRPMSFVAWRPNNSPRPFIYSYDSVKMSKTGRDNATPANWINRNIGIDPPQAEPTVTGGTLSGDSIFYRYVYRSKDLGVISAPSPEPVSAQTTLGGNGCSVVGVYSADPQVNTVDFYRYGGAILDYRFVGSVDNTNAGGGFLHPFVDNIPDLQLQQESQIIQEDTWRPFITDALPWQGEVTVVSNSPIAGLSTLTNLDPANNPWVLRMLPGVLVNLSTIAAGTGSPSNPYPVYGWNSSVSSLVIRGVPSFGAGNLKCSIPEPTFFAQALPYACGPYNGFVLATGDKYRPGALYWSNGNDPDSMGPTNFKEITSPSDPLGAPFMMGNIAYVFSAQHLFCINPSFDQVNKFTEIKTDCQRGLLFNWAWCTDGSKCWFLANDGIYETAGGAANCITNELYNLFPHEGSPSTAGTSTWLAPIWTELRGGISSRLGLRLVHNQGNIYFSYLDINSQYLTLVYSTRTKTWMSVDKFYPTVAGSIQVLYGGEGREVQETLAGGTNGLLYRMSTAAGSFYGESNISYQVRTGSYDFGDPGTRKLLGDITYEYVAPSGNVTVQAISNNEVSVVGADVGPTIPIRTQRIIDINSLGRNVCLDFSWTESGSPTPTNSTELFMWMPSAVPKPETEQARWQDWHNFIDDGVDAYVTGILLKCSTDDITGTPQSKSITIWADNASTGITRTFTAANEQWIELSWPVFKAKLARIVSNDVVNWRVFEWKWIADKEPPDIGYWDTNWRDATQGSDCGYVTGITVECDTHNVLKGLVFQGELEGIVTSYTPVSGSSTVQANGRTNHTFTFTPPFRAQQLRFYSSDNTVGRLYDWKWYVSPEPPPVANFNANFEDGGYLGAKFIQGVIIDADTQGVNKTVNLETEDGIIYSFIVNHAKRMGKAYSPPFARVATKFRALPADANPSWFYGSRWVFEPHPESVWNYETQFTSLGLEGWWHVRDGYIAYESNCLCYALFELDNGTQFAITLPDTTGVYRKVYIVLPAYKIKLAKFKICTFLQDPAIPVVYNAVLS